MGANPKDQDDVRYNRLLFDDVSKYFLFVMYLQESHTPEDFLDSDKYLSHRGLLKDFGADEATMDEMLNDKGTVISI